MTGLEVNGDGPPRTPRKLLRRVRAAIFNLKKGKPLKEGETVAHLMGLAAFIYMTDPKTGGKFLNELRRLAT